MVCCLSLQTGLLPTFVVRILRWGTYRQTGAQVENQWRMSVAWAISTMALQRVIYE